MSEAVEYCEKCGGRSDRWCPCVNTIEWHEEALREARDSISTVRMETATRCADIADAIERLMGNQAAQMVSVAIRREFRLPPADALQPAQECA